MYRRNAIYGLSLILRKLRNAALGIRSISISDVDRTASTGDTECLNDGISSDELLSECLSLQSVDSKGIAVVGSWYRKHQRCEACIHVAKQIAPS